MAEGEKRTTRRQFLAGGVRGTAWVSFGALTGLLVDRSRARETVWQIDPDKCTQCGGCATECVLEVSAVKCIHAFAMCGYCKLCNG